MHARRPAGGDTNPEISAAVWRDGGRQVGALASSLFSFFVFFLKGRSPGIAWRLAGVRCRHGSLLPLQYVWST
jgi:hypothetical protein